MAKKTDVRNLFRKAASKNSLPDLLIAASSMNEGVERSAGQLNLTTAFEQFQITNVHSADSYRFEPPMILHAAKSSKRTKAPKNAEIAH